jgi:hypothetical protein
MEVLATEDVGIFMVIWSVLRPFVIFVAILYFCDRLVYFVAIWYTSPDLVPCTRVVRGCIQRSSKYFFNIFKTH